MSKLYNSSSSHLDEINGGLPFVIHPELLRYRMLSFEVKNSLREGEKIPAGTPMQINVANHEAKLLKMWKIKSATADAEAGTTAVVIHRTELTPELTAATVLMVAPASASGTGKAAVPSALSINNDGDYALTLTTASFDALAANGFLCEAAEAGAGKKAYCEPNSITTVDLVIGNEYNIVDAPIGLLHCFENTINPMSAGVKSAIEGSKELLVVWEQFNTTHSS